MLRIVSFMVAVFVCTWYLCILSMYVALRLNLQEDSMNYVMIFTTILAFIAYSQNFYVLWLHNPRYRRTFSEQMKWLNLCHFVRPSSKTTADSTEKSPQSTFGKDRNESPI
ncbi:hypothetical protein ANCCAN_25430 [Ancylostoma caninum]|uniref:G-protein coupled receptors family 1 profile domain-containing protein n=1 Tax=Ancylostoma caninum TaxID=29170 RepID=A0A368FCS6_ANCCA|nr:hypothetical protein ANCCAN_25430 [Ancylostoma caninum]